MIKKMYLYYTRNAYSSTAVQEDNYQNNGVA